MSSPPSPVFLLSGVGMTGAAAFFVLAWQKRQKESLWPFVGIGAVAWIAGVALKMGFAETAPIDDLRLLRWFGERFGAPAHWLYVGLLTGVFECGATLLFVTKSRVRYANWNQAVAFGLGFGAVEAFLVGLLSFGGMATAILFWSKVPGPGFVASFEAWRRRVGVDPGEYIKDMLVRVDTHPALRIDELLAQNWQPRVRVHAA